MADRKKIPKKMRFEVFKRDSFTCQYCGRKAPDVVLECDHIKPVAEGGKNTLLNLVTSCMDCNRGKGKILLSDNTAISRQREQMELLNQRREQMEMMLQWRDELETLENREADIISDMLCSEGKELVEEARRKVKMLIRKYGFNEVVDATQISIDRYIICEGLGLDYAFDKIGGICYNRANGIRGGKTNGR